MVSVRTAVVLALALVALAAVPVAAADGLAVLWVTPEEQAVEPGERFEVDLMVQSAPQFASGATSVTADVAFDPEYVRAVDIERGPFITQGEETDIRTLVSDIDNDAGRLAYGVERNPPAGGVTTEAAPATVTFQVREDAPVGQFEVAYLRNEILLTDGQYQRATTDPALVEVTERTTGGTPIGEGAPVPVSGRPSSALVAGAAVASLLLVVLTVGAVRRL